MVSSDRSSIKEEGDQHLLGWAPPPETFILLFLSCFYYLSTLSYYFYLATFISLPVILFFYHASFITLSVKEISTFWAKPLHWRLLSYYFYLASIILLLLYLTNDFSFTTFILLLLSYFFYHATTEGDQHLLGLSFSPQDFYGILIFCERGA